ncbi:peptidase [Pseudoroseicyclus sp. CXY001]|uniref:peptidase n=1 Tax=Pseudoroseicyclus sp. CXY001 TaxID=3242492 RepID=UPI00357161D7
MTYCVALKLDQGLVFMSDTRTNAGLDNISTFRKMFSWSDGKSCAVTLLAAGNLATTQSVVSHIEERMKAPAERAPSILTLPSMFQVARMLGQLLKDVIAEHAESGQRADAAFNASLIVGGQIKGSEPRLFLIYPEGNFIEAGEDTPWFQIGEVKYGRPILVRTFQPEMSFAEAAKLLYVSFDSTIKANLSVGLPLDMQIYKAGGFSPGAIRRIEADDETYLAISEMWSQALKDSFAHLPEVEV